MDNALAHMTNYLEQGLDPLRLAFNDEDQFPRIVSLWYQYIDGEFFCVTPDFAWAVGHLKARPEVGFEVASSRPPYRGVRGTGRVELSSMDNDPLLEKIGRAHV